MAALLHERVIKVKKEIDWDNEELRLQEQRRREKEFKQCDSSDESEQEYPIARQSNRRRGNRVWSGASESGVGKSSISVSRLRDDDSPLHLSLPIDPCAPFEDNRCENSDDSSEADSEFDSVDDKEYSSSEQDDTSKHRLDRSDSSVYDDTNVSCSETEGTCNATAIILSESVSESGNDESPPMSMQRLYETVRLSVTNRESLSPTESNHSLSPLLRSVNLKDGNMRQERSGAPFFNPSGELPGTSVQRTTSRGRETARRGRPFVPVSMSKFVSEAHVKSEPESESQTESESELDQSPSESVSEMEFDDQEFFSGYESGYIDELRDKRTTRSQAKTPPVSPVHLSHPPEHSLDAISGSTCAAGQTDDSSTTTFLVDGRRISTSTPVTVKMKSLQLSLTKTALRSPVKEVLSSSLSTDSTLETPPKEPPLTGHMTSHPDPQEQLSFGDITNDVDLCSPSRSEPLSSSHMTDAVTHEAFKEPQPSSHMTGAVVHESSKEPQPSSHMTGAVVHESSKEPQPSSHMTGAVVHESSKEPQPSSHMTGAVVHESSKERQPSSHMTDAVTHEAFKEPQPSSHMTDAVTHEAFKEPQPSSHMTGAVVHESSKEPQPSSHMTGAVVHESSKEPQPSSHMTGAVAHESSKERQPSSHMTDAVTHEAFKEPQPSSHMTDAVTHEAFKEPQPSSHMTGAVVHESSKEPQPSSHMTGAVVHESSKEPQPSSHMTGAVVHESSKEPQPSSHMTCAVTHESSKEPQPFSHMTDTVNLTPPKNEPLTSHMTNSGHGSPQTPKKELSLTSHMTESVYHTPTREPPSVPTTSNSTNHKPRVRARRRSSSVGHVTSSKARSPVRRTTIEVTDSTFSWSEPRRRGPRPSHMTKSTSTFQRSLLTYLVTDSTICTPPKTPSSPGHMTTASHVTDSTIHTPPSTPPSSGHMTSSNNLNYPMESPSDSHMTDYTGHTFTPPKSPTSTTHTAKCTNHNRPIESPSASHMISRTSVTEAQTQTDVSMSSESTTEINVSSSSLDCPSREMSVDEKLQQPLLAQQQQHSPIECKKESDTTFSQGHGVSSYHQRHMHTATNDTNENKETFSSQQSHSGVCNHHLPPSPLPPPTCSYSCLCHRQDQLCQHGQLTMSPQQSPNSGGKHTHTTPTSPSHSQVTNPVSAVQHEQGEKHVCCRYCCHSPLHVVSPQRGLSPTHQVNHTQETCTSCPFHSSPSRNANQVHVTDHTHATPSCSSHNSNSSPIRDPRVHREHHPHAVSSSPSHSHAPQVHRNSAHNMPSSPSHILNPSPLPIQVERGGEHHVHITSSFPSHGAPTPQGNPAHTNMSSCSSHYQTQSAPNAHMQQKAGPSYPSHFSNCGHLPTCVQSEDYPHPTHLHGNSAHTMLYFPAHSSSGLSRDATPTRHVPPSPSHVGYQSHVRRGSHTHGIPSSPSHTVSACRPSSHVQSHTHGIPSGPSHSVNSGHVVSQCCPSALNNAPVHGSHAHIIESYPSHSPYPGQHRENHTHSVQSGSTHIPNSNNAQVYNGTYSPQHGGNHTHIIQSGSSHPDINHTHNVHSCPSHFCSPNTSRNHNDSSSSIVHSVNHTHNMPSCPSFSLNSGHIVTSPSSQQYTGSHTHTMQSCPSHSAIPSPGHNLNNAQVHSGNHTHTCPAHSGNCSSHSPERADTDPHFLPHTPPSHHAATTYKRVREEGEEMCCATQLTFPPAKRHCH